MIAMFDILVPLTKQGFYSETQVEQNARAMDRIKNSLGGIIRDCTGLIGISEALEATKIFVESGGSNVTRPGSKFIGYSQISAETAIYSAWYEFKRGRMSPQEEAQLVKILGNTKVQRIKTAPSDIALKGVITSNDLQPAFNNIFFGTLYFKQCIDKEHVLGQAARLDKAIVRYNAGFFYSIPNTLNTDSLLRSSIKQESKDYVLKMFGSTSPLPYALTIFNT